MNTDRINILLDEIEATEEFASFSGTLRDTLEDQWLDITASGVIEDVYDESGINSGNKSKNPAMKRAIALWVAYGLLRNKVKVERWVYNKIISNVRSSSHYKEYVTSVKDYFTYVFNRGGQKELDQLLGKGVMEFNLSNTYYRGKIRERSINLYNDWSKTTAKRYTSEIMKGLKKKETKTQMVTRIVGQTADIADYRKDVIGVTESNAILEYGRLETARMNGVEWKIWHTADDERVCSVCDSVNGETVPIDESFSIGIQSAPAHSNCRCYSDFVYDNYGDDVEKKKKNTYVFYENEKNRIYPIGLNKEYVWTGGNSYKGRDRDMDSFIGSFSKKDYDSIQGQKLDNLVEFINSIPRNFLPYEMYFSVKDFKRVIENTPELPMMKRLEITGLPDAELAVIMAKSILTKTGFTQLLKKI